MVRSPRSLRAVVAAAVVGSVLLLAGCGGSSSEAEVSVAASASAAGGTDSNVLLDAESGTVLDQRITYPRNKPAQVSSSIVELEPGQETGWHKHKAPMYVYVLEGTVSVEYDAGVTKEYPAGTAMVEAVDVWHNGTNKGTEPVRMLVVNIGAKGVKNTVER
jgi:quercetin dioxygenase-like cupin family protein